MSCPILYASSRFLPLLVYRMRCCNCHGYLVLDRERLGPFQPTEVPVRHAGQRK